jgi:hypothetical protein
MNNAYQEGKYRAVILDQAFEKASTGSPRFVLKLQIQGCYNAQGNLDPCQQLKRTYSQTLNNETGISILLADLKAMGVNVEDLSQLHPGLEGSISLVGRQVDVSCRHESYQGRMVERWGINRPKLTLAAVQAVQEQFGHLLKKSAA